MLHHHLHHRDKKMFKWKVSGLGGKKEKSPKTTRLNNDTSITEDNSKNNKVKENNNKKDK